MRAGWLTLHEVLDVTGLPYTRLLALVEQGLVRAEQSGAAVLYDPDDVALLLRAGRRTSASSAQPPA